MNEAVEYASVWDHFQRTADDGEVAICAMCNKPIRCKNSSTTGLHRHLELIHHLKRRPRPATHSSASPSKHAAAASARKRKSPSVVACEATPLIEYDDLWDHFQKIGEIASCRLCSKFLQCKSNGTSGLHRHLEGIHAMKRFKRPPPVIASAVESSTASEPPLAIQQVDGGTYAGVWDHFQHTDSADAAECRICGKIIQCKSSSTSGLRRHLEMIHAKQRQHGHTPAPRQRTFTIKNEIAELPLQSPVLMDDRPVYDSVWDHFQSLGDVAECLMCWKRIQCKASSTSGLHRHLEKIHDMQRRRLTPPPAKKGAGNEDEMENIPTAKPLPSPVSVATTSLLNHKRTLEQIVSELIAKDGISMAAIANSSFIRSSLIAAGHPHPPTDPSVILRMLLTVAGQVHDQLAAKIASTKCEQRRFSIAVADWHGCRTRRYRQVWLYYDNGDIDHLGLIRRRRLSSAAELGDRVADKLSEFGIDWRTDVVACTTDDVSAVEWSDGKHCGPHRQRCYVEGIRAAVMAVLFRPRSAFSVKIENEDSTSADWMTDEEENDVTDMLSGDVDAHIVHDKTVQLAPEFHVVSKIQRIVRWFRRSAVNTAVLLEYTPAGGQLLSKLSRWRWDSFETILTEYMRLRQPVEQALQHLGRADLANMSAEQQQQCLRIVQALKPIRLAVDTLRRTDANLLRADAVLRFLFANLAAQRTEMGTSFLESLQLEFGARREATMSAMVGLLCGPTTPAGGGRWPQQTQDATEDVFRLPGQERVLEAAAVMWRRLFELPCKAEQFVADAGDPLSVVEAIVEDTNGVGGRTDDDVLTKELEMYLQQVSDPTATTNPTSTTIADELKVFANGGQQTQNVRRLMSALGTVRPTVANRGQFGALRRTIECDEAVDSVCLLEFFLNKTQK